MVLFLMSSSCQYVVDVTDLNLAILKVHSSWRNSLPRVCSDTHNGVRKKLNKQTKKNQVCILAWFDITNSGVCGI